MPHLARRLWILPLALALMLATGCGSSSPKAGPTAHLTASQLKSALLTASGAGAAFRAIPTIHGNQDPGCIAKLNDVQATGETPDDKAEQSFQSKDGPTPLLRSDAATYKTRTVADHQLAYLATLAKKCSAIHDDTDGTPTKVKVTVSTKKTLSGVDAQTTVTAVGSSQQEEVSTPIAFQLTMAQIGNNVMTFTYLDHTRTVSAGATVLATAAYKQFKGVANPSK